MNWRQRREYLLMRECHRRSDRLSSGATAAETAAYEDKYLFNDAFREFVEGNINYPDPIVVQLNGSAFRRKLKKFMEQR